MTLYQSFSSPVIVTYSPNRILMTILEFLLGLFLISTVLPEETITLARYGNQVIFSFGLSGIGSLSYNPLGIAQSVHFPGIFPLITPSSYPFA